jgi:hypothetical protein
MEGIIPYHRTGSPFSASPLVLVPHRTFAVNRKVIDAKNAKRLKIQQQKKKNKKPHRNVADKVGSSPSPSFPTF